MTITVASAALDTTWVEFGAVAYNAGSLADQDACVTEVESKLKRGTLSASTTPSTTDIKRWLQRAKQELAETRQFTWKRRYVTTTLTAGTWRYSLPQDFAGGRVNVRDLSNDKRIPFVSSHTFDVMYPDPAEEASGEMLVCTVKNLELWVMPPPGTDSIELEYERSGDDVTATDFSWLPEIERFRCCDYATHEAFLSLLDKEMAGIYYSRWKQGLVKATRSDGKRRYSSMGYRARSIFQVG